MSNLVGEDNIDQKRMAETKYDGDQPTAAKKSKKRSHQDIISLSTEVVNEWKAVSAEWQTRAKLLEKQLKESRGKVERLQAEIDSYRKRNGIVAGLLSSDEVEKELMGEFSLEICEMDSMEVPHTEKKLNWNDRFEQLIAEAKTEPPASRCDVKSAWIVRFRELVLFKEEHGHCDVPRRYPDNPALGGWVQNQRYEKKLLDEGKASGLTPGKLRALTNIGFNWK